MPELATDVRSAVKRYGEITAVDGLDLAVPTGVCFGLLGPNGADKSTTMRMLTAQWPARSACSATGCRRSPSRRMEMGVVPQLDNLDIELTRRQILSVFARLYRVPRQERRAAVERALAIANLAARADTKVSDLCGGMLRRLLVARGLIHRPRLVLLDEPTVGLDPQIRQELWTLIDVLRSEGVTMLMSTHYIEEAERLADTVAVMSAGKVIAQGTPAELTRAHAGERVLEVRLSRAARGAGRARREAGLVEPAQRPGDRDHAGQAARGRRARGDHAAGEPRGRLRGLDRRGDRVSAGAQAASSPRRGSTSSGQRALPASCVAVVPSIRLRSGP
jgi:lipooligosaccharide transport system ATP-binding protein